MEGTGLSFCEMRAPEIGDAGGSSFEELSRKVIPSPSFGKVNCLIGETAFLPSFLDAFCEKFWF